MRHLNEYKCIFRELWPLFCGRDAAESHWACYDLHEDITPLFFRIYELKHNTFDKCVHESSDKAAQRRDCIWVAELYKVVQRTIKMSEYQL